MNQKVHNQIVSFIWSIADDVLRDVFVRGKYRDIILPFTVLRRLDALLVLTKEKVLEANDFLIENNIDDKKALENQSSYPFWNNSKFTMGDSAKKVEGKSELAYTSLMDDADNIDTNLEAYLDGFSPNVQEIISKFKLRNQLETMKEAGVTYLLIEKLCNKELNLSPNEAKNSKDETLEPLTNLGMGYVFEELIRKFNEENNEEAGEHFTPREIIQLMTHILFTPVKDKIKKGAYLIYDPACGSGGMLTEAEHFAMEVTDNKADFMLYGQEVNPETYAICTSDMLIKGKKSENIAYGSTLGKDGFPHLHFDFMLSNPPYGKTWKIDEDAIVSNRGKKGSQNIKDKRFDIGLPSISDGQLLFLMNMVSKMKHNTELGSRIATVHNGSALFTGDAGGGESEIRKHIIENDWLECIIALPKNIFYNTGIPTYIWIVSNKKDPKRKGKVQLINAMELYEKLRKNLGQKNCEMKSVHIDAITQLYMDFTESDISKIYPNEYFGYHKITVERPLRLSAQFTPEAIATLRQENSLNYDFYDLGITLIEDFIAEAKNHTNQKNQTNHSADKLKVKIETILKKEEINLKTSDKQKLLSAVYWQSKLDLIANAEKLMTHFGNKQFDDYNSFVPLLHKTIKELKLDIDAKGLKAITDAITWKNEDAERVRKIDNGKLKIDNEKIDVKVGEVIYPKGFKPTNSQLSIINSQLYLADSDLRDTENVPLDQDIYQYFEREVLQHIPDAWIDESKTVKGYEISFTRYFYNYVPPRSIEEITAEILQLEKETDGILNEIVNN